MNKVSDLDVQRTSSLAQYDVLDTPPEQTFDEIATLAAALCRVPIAVINFVADGRQFCKAAVGLGSRETPLMNFICADALLKEDFIVIRDTADDYRFGCNPLSVERPPLRFYAGALLKSAEGIPIGMLCVLDYEPRDLDQMQKRDLLISARQIMTVLEMRRVALEARSEKVRHRAVVDCANEFGIIVTDLDGLITDWSAGAQIIFGWPESEMIGQPISSIFTGEDCAAGIPYNEMASALSKGRGQDERRHERRGGERFWASGGMSPLRVDSGRHIGYVKVLRDRTVGYMAAQALQSAEARLRQAHKAGGIGLFTIDMMEDVITVTPEFCRIYGLPVKSEYPASETEARIIAEDRHLVATAGSRYPGEAQREVEYRVKFADTGELRWVARTGEVEFDDKGRPRRLVGIARDVTEQRLARDALARSESRYRALFEAIDEGFCIIESADEPDGSLGDYVHLEANPGYERHTGISNVVGKTMRDIDPAGANEWIALYDRVLSTGESVRFERYFSIADRHIEVSAARVEPKSRRQVSVLFRDVSEQIKAVEAQRVSEAIAQESIQRVQLALAAGAIIGTWLWDLPNDRFTVDEPFARTFGIDPTLGRKGLTLAQVVATVHPDDQEGLATAINEVIKRGGAYAHQYRVRRDNGKYYWIEANGRVEHGPDGTPLRFPGVLLDVQMRRAVEEERDRAAASLRTLTETLEQRVAERTAELMRAEEQLRQSQKMEAVGQLTGGLAHDFNNLLMAISSNLHLAQGRLGAEHPALRYVDNAALATQRGSSLTAQLLAFSRTQRLDMRPVELDAVVQNAPELLGNALGPTIAIHLDLRATNAWVLADAHQLHLAILNLALNARDAMPAGGSFSICTVVDDSPLPDASSSPRFATIRVSDTGVGMAPDVIDRAIEPFFTTKERGRGTGLGLAQVYGVVKQCGGDLRITSAPGHGTTVDLLLPLTLEREAAKPPLPQAGTPAASNVACIGPLLVIDDDEQVRFALAEMFRSAGYDVIEAQDGAVGLRLLDELKPVLAIIDFIMPGMNGAEVARLAREKLPELPIIFVSGYADTLALDKIGNAIVLRKPVGPEALFDAVDNALRTPQATL